MKENRAMAVKASASLDAKNLLVKTGKGRSILKYRIAHGRFLDAHDRALRHGPDGCHPPRLPGEATLTDKIVGA